MIERYALHDSADSIREAFVVDIPESYRATYNAGPTQLLPIITSEDPRGMAFFYWGLMPNLSNNKTISTKLINLPATSAFQKAGYKRRIATHRCIVPMNGFYLWKPVAKKQRIPYYFFPRQGGLLGCAGLWEESEDFEGNAYHSFILLTVPASRPLAEFDSDMPAILTPSGTRVWLDSEESAFEELISSITNHHPSLSSHSVSPEISNLGNNYEWLIESRPPSDQHGNYTLFT